MTSIIWSILLSMLELLCWNAAIIQSLSTAFVTAGVGTAETEGVIGGLKRFRMLKVSMLGASSVPEVGHHTPPPGWGRMPDYTLARCAPEPETCQLAAE